MNSKYSYTKSGMPTADNLTGHIMLCLEDCKPHTMAVIYNMILSWYGAEKNEENENEFLKAVELLEKAGYLGELIVLEKYISPEKEVIKKRRTKLFLKNKGIAVCVKYHDELEKFISECLMARSDMKAFKEKNERKIVDIHEEISKRESHLLQVMGLTAEKIKEICEGKTGDDRIKSLEECVSDIKYLVDEIKRVDEYKNKLM